MKKRMFAAAGLAAVLVLAGCQSGTSGTETEELKRQIAELEQQVTALEQDAAVEVVPETTQKEQVNEQIVQNEGQETQTETNEIPKIEELTEEVKEYLEKVKNVVPASAEVEKMEQFFELKREEEALERKLDRYENELEAQYRNGELNRDDYRTLERDAEYLEEQLDDTEDILEYTFGIDD